MTIQLDHSMLDVYFRSLADDRRRFVISFLLDDGDGSVSLDELADGLLEAESRSTTSDRQALKTSLVHDHLPRLAEAGLVGYDRDRDVVTTTSRTDQIQPYVTLVEDLSPSGGAPR